MKIKNCSEIVLLVHGLGGTTYDFGLLRARLQSEGLHCTDLLLSGHGSQPDALKYISSSEWIGMVANEVENLKRKFDTVHVVGMCMGALLAAQAAKLTSLGKNGRDKLVLLAPPLFLDGWSLPWYRALRYVAYRIPGLTSHIRYSECEPYGVKNRRTRALLQKKFSRGDSFHYSWVPLSTIRELDKLRAVVKNGLDTISCSTLLVHAVDDELTSLKSAQYIRDKINSAGQQKLARLVVLSDSYHMICIDNERDDVMKNVSGFLSTAFV